MVCGPLDPARLADFKEHQWPPTVLRCLVGIALVALAGVAAPASERIRLVPAAADSASRLLFWSAGEPIADMTTATDQSQPQLAADTDGSLHLVWIDTRYGGREVFYTRYAGDTRKWRQPLRVAPRIAGRQSQPAVAVDSIGSVHVVWLELAAAGSELWHCLIPVHGSSCRDVVQVPTSQGAELPQQPAIVADPWGTVHLVWVASRGPAPQLYYAQRPYGGRWSLPSPVQPGPTAQLNPALCVTRLGDLYLVWEEQAPESSAIRASRLPPGGKDWWPAVELARGGGAARPRQPEVAADSRPSVRAVWIAGAGGTALETALLRSEEGEWQSARLVYRSSAGPIDSLGVAGGPGEHQLMLWTEQRPGGRNMLSGPIADGELTTAPFGLSRDYSEPGEVLIAVDTEAVAHALWVARRYDGQQRLLHAWSRLPRSTYPAVEYEGWLQYRWAEWNCRGDGFVVVRCDGSASPLIRPTAADLVPLLGEYVSLTAEKVEDTCCVHGRAQRAAKKPSPCPRSTGGVTGQVSFLGVPAVWELVAIGDRLAPTGDSGRFFINGLPTGVYSITATVACSLMARLEGVAVGPGQVVHLEPVELVPGEVLPDCRVDVRDLARVTALYRSLPPWGPPCADQNGDGLVDLVDVALVAANLGRSCPTPWSRVGRQTGLPEGPFVNSATPYSSGTWPAGGSAAADCSAPRPPASRSVLQPFDARAPGDTRAPDRSTPQRSGARPLAAGGLELAHPPRLDRGAIWLVDGRQMPAERLSLWYAGAADSFAWEVELSAPGCVPADGDLATPGLQPFRPFLASSELWTVANEMDRATGLLRWAATLTTAGPDLAGDGRLAEVHFVRPCGVRTGLASWLFLDRRGGVAPGLVRLEDRSFVSPLALPLGLR